MKINRSEVKTMNKYKKETALALDTLRDALRKSRREGALNVIEFVKCNEALLTLKSYTSTITEVFETFKKKNNPATSQGREDL